MAISVSVGASQSKPEWTALVANLRKEKYNFLIGKFYFEREWLATNGTWALCLWGRFNGAILGQYPRSLVAALTRPYDRDGDSCENRRRALVKWPYYNLSANQYPKVVFSREWSTI